MHPGGQGLKFEARQLGELDAGNAGALELIEQSLAPYRRGAHRFFALLITPSNRANGIRTMDCLAVMTKGLPCPDPGYVLAV